MDYFMKFIISLFCNMILTACQPVPSGNVEQLKQEVLNQVSDCGDESLRRSVEDRINRQSQHLSETQMIRSLQNMKQDIRCG